MLKRHFQFSMRRLDRLPHPQIARGGPYAEKDRAVMVGASTDLQLVGADSWNDRTVVVSWKRN